VCNFCKKIPAKTVRRRFLRAALRTRRLANHVWITYVVCYYFIQSAIFNIEALLFTHHADCDSKARKNTIMKLSTFVHHLDLKNSSVTPAKDYEKIRMCGMCRFKLATCPDRTLYVCMYVCMYSKVSELFCFVWKISQY